MTRPYLGPCKHCHSEGEEKIYFVCHVVECEDGNDFENGYSAMCIQCGAEVNGEYRDETANLWNGVVPVEEDEDA